MSESNSALPSVPSSNTAGLILTLDQNGEPSWQAPAASGDVGGGATDTVVTLDVAENPAAMAIVAVDTGAQTFTVAGDQRKYFSPFLLALELPGCIVAGSTANDGDYIPSAVSYDAGSDQTTITFDGGPPDPTIDGTLQPTFTSVLALPLPAQSTVEWVYFEVLEAFDPVSDDLSPYAYVWCGDATNPLRFATGINQGHSPHIVDLTAVGKYQWPANTVNPPSGATAVVGLEDDNTTPSGLQYYPDATTVYVAIAVNPNTQVGSVRVTIHHHFDEVGEPVVNGG